MGGSVNLRGGGQYQVPSVQGGQGFSPTYAPSGYGARFGGQGNFGGGYGMPSQYDGGDFGGQFPGVSTGGKGFQQQPQYNFQPAPVMRPYVDQTSTGGKGFQPRQTPSQSVAYAPMNIPGMSFAQPQYFNPNLSQQMLSLGGLGGLGATMPMFPRPGIGGQYPALQPPAPPPPPQPIMGPPTSTGGKGFMPAPPAPRPLPFNPELNPVMPSNPNLTPVSPRNPFEYETLPIRYEDRQLPRADERLERREQNDNFFSRPIDVDGQREDLGQIVYPAVQPEIQAFPFENENNYPREYDMPGRFPMDTPQIQTPIEERTVSPPLRLQELDQMEYTPEFSGPEPAYEPSVLPEEPVPATQPIYEDTREYFPERYGDFGMETLD